MKDKYTLIITLLGILLFISIVLGFILFEVSMDLTATANGYKSDRDICEREYEELQYSYEKAIKELEEE